MLYNSSTQWRAAANKRVALIGMSGLGKTYLSTMLRRAGDWFHYSIDYRIGTRYMGEYIVDNFKREAMKSPYLRDLLLSDSISIRSNISFENLAPLSGYLGKPGDPAKGGIAFEDYVKRQRQHQLAESAATSEAGRFAGKATAIYGYDHFVADTSGSVCEVTDPNNPADPVLIALSSCALPVWIRGAQGHTDTLLQRFTDAPKPMYYNEAFLRDKWAEYLKLNTCTEAQVDPDDFAIWGYRELLAHRLPLYESIARNWGVTVEADEVSSISTEQDFIDLVAIAIDRNTTPRA